MIRGWFATFVIFNIVIGLALVSCSKGSVGSSMGSPDGEQAIPKPGAEPISIPFSGVDTIVQGDGVYYTLSPECTKNGTYELDTASTYKYTIQNGKLYILNEEDCQARVLTGTSNELNGIWTTDGTYADFPGLESTESCEDENEWDFETKGTVEISGVEMRADMVMENFCWAKLSAGSRENGDVYTMVGCDSLTWNRQGKIAGLKLLSFKIEDYGNEYQIRFSYEGKTCTRLKTPYRKPSPETCAQAYQLFAKDSVDYFWFNYWDYSEVYQTDLADELAYEKCIAEAGFPESDYEPGN